VKRTAVRVLVGVVASLAISPAVASAGTGVEHLHFRAGPYLITPGANLILLQSNQVPKPTQDGYMVRFQPNLVYAHANGTCCGTIPQVSVIHLHHGVWLSNGTTGEGDGNSYYGGFYPFAAVGEEKTILSMPKGYGYPVGAHDLWVLNYMIHNLTPIAARVYITYDVDFVPMSSPLAKTITPVHPIWMDVMDRHLYPVFNVARHSGRGGKFTFPDMAKNPYPGEPSPLNEFKLDHPGTLIGTAGHLHPGGLWDELDLLRTGASPSHGALTGLAPGSVRLFRSNAHYFDKRGPISWNMAMQATAADWRPRVQAGDTLRISATYDTTRASWYEVMGIMVVWEAYNSQSGVDPFTHKLDQSGHLTHGYYPENNDNGGSFSLGLSVKNFPTCHAKQVVIRKFKYNPGDFTASGRQRCVPTITSGQAITFVNADSQSAPAGQGGLGLGSILNPPFWYTKSIFHSITSCQNPCGLNTGISYPLANGSGSFDSGQLGPALPAVGTLTWTTPANLKPGTYTYFCRIHPFMRGVFRIVK
jgi:plastocyanin